MRKEYILSSDGVSHTVSEESGIKMPRLFETETESERERTQFEFDRAFKEALSKKNKERRL